MDGTKTIYLVSQDNGYEGVSSVTSFTIEEEAQKFIALVKSDDHSYFCAPFEMDNETYLSWVTEGKVDWLIEIWGDYINGHSELHIPDMKNEVERFDLDAERWEVKVSAANYGEAVTKSYARIKRRGSKLREFQEDEYDY